MGKSFAIADYDFNRLNLPKVLLVEDDPNAQMIFKFYLSKLKIRVVIVDTGRKSLAAIKKTTYDMMILDIGLPDLTGEHVLSTIRSQEQSKNPKNSLPIIIVTAHGDREKSRHYLEQGASAALIKPISFATLSMWCERLLPKPSAIQLSQPF